MLGCYGAREIKRVQHLAAREERMRLARELHDGVLQSLSVAALKLQLTLQLIADAPRIAAEHLERVQELLIQEQRNVRLFVNELKTAMSAPESKVNIENVLRPEIRRVEEQCELPVILNVAGAETPVTGALAHEICQIVREGLFNVARHAGASAAQVEVIIDPTDVHVTISDNGRGFPFRGRYDHDALTAVGTAPAVLKSRVDSLEGSLTIHSADTGANVEITLPLVREGV